MNEAEVRKEFNKLFNENKNIESIYRKIRNDTASYEEANKFASEIGNIISKVFGDHFNENFIDDTTIYIVENLLNQNVRLTSLVCEAVQTNLNMVEGIGLNPVTPNPLRTKEKITGTITAIKETSGDTSALTLLEQNAKTMTLALVDEWVKTNADFQAKAGLNPVIVRKWDGITGSHDTRHTDWCSKLQGTFDYGKEPKDVYKRHRGCGCVVMYYPSKYSQGKITALAKGEKDTEEQLWNTNQVFSNSRSAILRRRRDKLGKDEARKILNEEWQGGFNGNAERHFS